MMVLVSMRTGQIVGVVLGGVLTGLVFVALGLLIAGAAGSGRLKRWVELRPTPIAAIAQGALVKIRGRVRPGPSGVVQSPVSGRAAVVFSVAAAGHGAKARRVVLGSHAGEFWLDDESGAAARIVSDRAAIHVVEDWWLELPATILRAGVRQHGKLSQAARDWVLPRYTSRYPLAIVEDAAIEPGQMLTVVGSAYAEGSDRVFRSRPSEPLGLLGDVELLRSQLGGQRTIGLAMTAFGVLVIVGAVAAATLM